MPTLFATWNRLITLPRLLAVAVALSDERMTVARMPTAKPEPTRATMSISTELALSPMRQATSATTSETMLMRRWPIRSETNPAGRSMSSRANPKAPTITPAVAMLTPKSLRMSGRSGVMMFVAETMRNSETASRNDSRGMVGRAAATASSAATTLTGRAAPPRRPRG